MKVYRYWATLPVTTSREGKEFCVYVRGYSNESEEAALRHAEQRKEDFLNHVQTGEPYELANETLREEVLRELDMPQATPAVITRNRYGCQVLNTTDVIMTDHDLGASYEYFPIPFLPIVFSGTATKDSQQLHEQIRSCVQKLGLSARLYSTRKGIRCIITNQTLPAGSSECIRLLRKLKCDAQYTHMTRIQRCYRARLTPKPLRIKCPYPPVKFPYPTPKAKEYFHEWLVNYEKQAAQFATCQFLEQIGVPPKHDRIR
ncbi:MAG: hypothetical protein D6820_02970, partial [Lentisphaerae bacterium]